MAFDCHTMPDLLHQIIKALGHTVWKLLKSHIFAIMAHERFTLVALALLPHDIFAWFSNTVLEIIIRTMKNRHCPFIRYLRNVVDPLMTSRSRKSIWLSAQSSSMSKDIFCRTCEHGICPFCSPCVPFFPAAFRALLWGRTEVSAHPRRYVISFHDGISGLQADTLILD